MIIYIKIIKPKTNKSLLVVPSFNYTLDCVKKFERVIVSSRQVLPRRNQGGAKGAEASPTLSKIKVEKKDKFLFLTNFVHTTRSKYYCNTIILS